MRVCTGITTDRTLLWFWLRLAVCESQAVGSLQGDSPTVMIAFMAAGLGLSLLSLRLLLRAIPVFGSAAALAAAFPSPLSA